MMNITDEIGKLSVLVTMYLPMKLENTLLQAWITCERWLMVTNELSCIPLDKP